MEKERNEKRMDAQEIIQHLEKNGYEALLVGGCVRDELMGVPSNDQDVTTNAHPEQIRTLFRGIASVEEGGARFLVMFIDGIEVATYRSEQYEVPGKPETQPVATFFEDASRRDFTFNAIAKKSDGTLIDHFQGREDIEKKQVRAVGDPLARFQEDPSRILRALYFAARFDFSIEKTTWNILCSSGNLLQQAPAELMGKIMMKVMKFKKMHRFVQLVHDAKLLPFVFPELAHTPGMIQNPRYHDRDVFEHIVAVIKATEMHPRCTVELTLDALYHDSGKGLPEIRGINNKGEPTDIGHEEKGAEIAKEALLRFGFGMEIAEFVERIIYFHGLRLPNDAKKSSIVRQLRKMALWFPDKQALKSGVEELFDFMACDAAGFEPEFGRKQSESNEELRKKFRLALETHVFYRKELGVNGNDLKEWGYNGKEIGVLLEDLIRMNLSNREEIFELLKKRQEKKKQ